MSPRTAVASSPTGTGTEAGAAAEPARSVSARPLRSRASRAARAARNAPPVALGSLTQSGARSGSSCHICHSERVTSLTLTLTDGTPVEFTSCHACENRTWFSATGELDRATVLERTRKIR